MNVDITKTAAFYAEVYNQFKRRLGQGWGNTEAEALTAARKKADEELRTANPNWKWRKAKSRITANPFKTNNSIQS